MVLPMVANPKAYAAFVSYRHTPRDREWAIRMFEALETYQTPKSLQQQGYPARLGKLFRDEDEIPASTDLSDQIRQALATARCSWWSAHPTRPNRNGSGAKSSCSRRWARATASSRCLIAGEPDKPFRRSCYAAASSAPSRMAPPRSNGRSSSRSRPTCGPGRTSWPAKTFERARLRVAAAILGVAYDDLYGREIERQKAHRRRVVGTAAACVLAVAGAGAWYWDSYLRVKIQYCASYGERWGEPFCVGGMSEAGARQQERVYQLKIKGGLPQELTRMNGSLSPASADDYDNLYQSEDWTKEAARFVYEYGKNEALAAVTQYRQTGQQLRRLRYDLNEDRQSGFVYFDRARGEAERQSAEGTILGSSIVAPLEGTNKQRTTIGQHRLRFDGAGYLSERHFERLGGGSASDAQGAYGRAYRYTSAGLVESIRNLDAVGDILVEKTGVAEMRRSYDAAGHLVTASWHSKTGELVLNQDLFARLGLGRDKFGRNVLVEYLGADGKPVLSKDTGAARLTSVYDDRGNEIEEAYSGLDGQPALYKDGFAILRQKYDERGNIIEVALFGVDGMPTLHKEGHAIIRRKYNERGNAIEEAYFGADGKPVLLKDGYAILRQKYDERGNAIEWANFGTDGKPALHKDGYATLRQKYDERGNVVEVALYGVDGMPALHKEGHAVIRRKYDERGNLTEQFVFGAGGQPVLQKDGFAILRQKYDERGNAIEVGLFRCRWQARAAQGWLRYAAPEIRRAR